MIGHAKSSAWQTAHVDALCSPSLSPTSRRQCTICAALSERCAQLRNCGLATVDAGSCAVGAHLEGCNILNGSCCVCPQRHPQTQGCVYFRIAPNRSCHVMRKTAQRLPNPCHGCLLYRGHTSGMSVLTLHSKAPASQLDLQVTSRLTSTCSAGRQTLYGPGQMPSQVC